MQQDNQTPLGALVTSGAGQDSAEPIAPGIFMVKDISNAYLVTTSGGDVMVNTGFNDNAERNVALVAPHRTGPLKAIVLTQSHSDHFGAVPEFLEDGTVVYGGPDYNEAWGDMKRLMPFFGPRTHKLWGSTLKRGSTPKPPPEVVPDVLVEDRLEFTVGNRRFVLISAPEGETIDNILVWLPEEKIVFTGNTFGPVFLSMPFLDTLRGDKPRLTRNYLKSLNKVRDLGAELLITGHGEPIRGADKIRADLTRMHDAVAHIRDYTLDGMIAGKGMHQLMREFVWPEGVAIGEFHGKASWAVKSIWREYAGWFDYAEGTTALYGVPRRAVDADLAELAGGAGAIAARAKALLDADKPLEALHLVDIALGADPAEKVALSVKKHACQLLLARSGSTNLSETMWLKSEIAEAEAALGA